jgi:hypothetical protein
LRRGPSIVLHGFGGLTYHKQTARAVEEATLTAMGPAAGLLFAQGHARVAGSPYTSSEPPSIAKL